MWKLFPSIFVMVAVGQNMETVFHCNSYNINYLANSFNGNGFYGPKYKLSNISMVTVSMN